MDSTVKQALSGYESIGTSGLAHSQLTIDLRLYRLSSRKSETVRSLEIT